MADMVDAQSQPEEVIIGDGPSDCADNDSDLTQKSGDVFIPPLQTKIELLKKATGVKNVYDDSDGGDAPQNSYDELNHIKRNAGINVVALDALGDDEPLDV